MQLTSLLGHAAEVLRIIRKSAQPADGILTDYVRSKKYIGSTERRFISELVFHAQRTLSLATLVQERCALPDVVHGALALSLSGVIPLPLDVVMRKAAGIKEGSGLEADMEAAVVWCAEHLATAEAARAVCDDATWACAQAWIMQRCALRWSQEDVVHVMRSFLVPAPLCLRVNLRLITRDEVCRELTAMNVAHTIGVHSPAAILIHERVNLVQHALYQNGLVEIQDEGSQLIGFACAPRDEDVVLDACAGAGGKTLHLADMRSDRGRIVAADIEGMRLKEVGTRARRAGLRNIVAHLWPKKQDASTSVAEGGRRYTDFPRDGFDVVLVDAPCSGSGTIRRLPMVKWRLTEELAERHARKQIRVLEDYARYVKPGGVLVYATCSILPDENEQVVTHFLSKHGEFTPDPLVPAMARMGVHVAGLGADAYMFQADPYHHGTDGLFMARMRRRENP